MEVMADSTFVVIQGSVFEFRPGPGEDAAACCQRVGAQVLATVEENRVFVHASPRPRDQPAGPSVMSYVRLQPGMSVQVFPGDMFQRFMREQQAAAMQQQVRQASPHLIRS